MAVVRILKDKTAAGSAPSDADKPPVSGINEAKGFYACGDEEFLVVELQLEGSAGALSAAVRPYSWDGHKWARRGADADVMEIDCDASDAGPDRRLLFRLDVRDTSALALACSSITGTDAKLNAFVGPAGKGY